MSLIAAPFFFDSGVRLETVQQLLDALNGESVTLVK